jgi:hypothetical protein
MPVVTLSSKYKINEDLLLSIDELKNIYLFGVPKNDRNGAPIPDSTFEFNIRAAQEQMQNFLGLLFKKQLYYETLQFTAEDFYNWSYLRMTYPVVCPMKLEGMLNTTLQVTYPSDWLIGRKTSDGILYHRNLYIVPAGNSTGLTQAQLFTGLIPNLSYLGLSRIPEYWNCWYITGFDKVPVPIIDAIGKLAAINIFRISGDLIISPGISSFSLGIDGLSQSMSAKAYDGRIKAMLDDLNLRILPELKSYYRGYLFSVC